MLTDLQVSRIFHLYCGCSVVSYGYPNNSPFVQQLMGVHQGYVYAYNHRGYIRDYKLLLKPLSAITDEDAKAVYKLCFDKDFAEDWSGDTGSAYFNPKKTKPSFAHVLRIIYGQDYTTDDTGLRLFSIFQYLIQQGYAVPLFIEVGHPDNGKTAIELKVAVDIATLKQTQ